MIDKDPLIKQVKILGGVEYQNKKIYTLWTKECKDPVKYLIAFESDGFSSEEKILIEFKTGREIPVLISKDSILIGKIRVELKNLDKEIKDDFLKKLLKSAVKF
ncbi:MAG: hypothetical protein GU362_03805 [Thaumarchaeota archaeon]|jgi:hypothetical protein|nr:hypothetical protein [Nitrososphaerota archaeon]